MGGLGERQDEERRGRGEWIGETHLQGVIESGEVFVDVDGVEIDFGRVPEMMVIRKVVIGAVVDRSQSLKSRCDRCMLVTDHGQSTTLGHIEMDDVECSRG